ncbi:MerR family DNA-binding protein [Pseudomonas syringae]|uniref:MerR family DNA-binding protein n=1 Tax=Pseudomonas syringae TaxID=317 RepID=UPI000940A78E
MISRAARRESGYRAYALSDVHRLRFIRRARDLGFSIMEIGELHSLWNDRSRQVPMSNALRKCILLT